MEPIEFMQQSTDIGQSVVIDRSFDWIFWILVIINVACMGIVRASSPNYLSALFSTAVFNRQLYQNAQEDLRMYSLASQLLNLVYFNCLAIVGSFIAFQETSYITLLIIVGTAAALLLKLGVMRVFVFLAQKSSGIYEHQLNHFVYMQIAGIILTPVLIFTYYLPPSIFEIVTLCLLSIVVFFILLREVQSFFRALKARIAPLYIILYLCTLEILPFVLIIRAFVSK